MILGYFSMVSQGETIGLSSMVAQHGYIILNTGDTIYGKFKSGKIASGYMSQVILIGQNKEKTHYNAETIMELGIEHIIYNDSFKPVNSFWEFFESKSLPKKGNMRLMRPFEKGIITVFYNSRSSETTLENTVSNGKIDGISFSYSFEDGLIFGPTTELITSIKTWYSSYYIEKEGGKLTKVNKKNYVSLWPSLFKDCPAIIKEVNKNPELKDFKNFLLIVGIYNQLCH